MFVFDCILFSECKRVLIGLETIFQVVSFVQKSCSSTLQNKHDIFIGHFFKIFKSFSILVKKLLKIELNRKNMLYMRFSLLKFLSFYHNSKYYSTNNFEISIEKLTEIHKLKIFQNTSRSRTLKPPTISIVIQFYLGINYYSVFSNNLIMEYFEQTTFKKIIEYCL